MRVQLHRVFVLDPAGPRELVASGTFFEQHEFEEWLSHLMETRTLATDQIWEVVSEANAAYVWDVVAQDETETMLAVNATAAIAKAGD